MFYYINVKKLFHKVSHRISYSRSSLHPATDSTTPQVWGAKAPVDGGRMPWFTSVLPSTTIHPLVLSFAIATVINTAMRRAYSPHPIIISNNVWFLVAILLFRWIYKIIFHIPLNGNIFSTWYICISLLWEIFFSPDVFLILL